MTAAGDFRGPFAGGAPLSALAVDAPALGHFGLAEVRRLIVGAWILSSAIVRSMVTRWLAVMLRRPAEARLAAVAQGAVDGFERLGPAWVKIG